MLKFLDPILWILLLVRVVKKKKVKKDNKRFSKEVDILFEEFKHIDKAALFYPEFPKRKAALSLTLRSMGYDVHNDPDRASSFCIAWEDTTYRDEIEAPSEQMSTAWNKDCLDIGKTRTDQIFEQVFGYSTRVDPLAHRGKMLEKSEINGTHEATIVTGPIKEMKDGYIYQLVLNNKVKGYLYEDVRVTYIKGKIPFCYLNYRLKGKRFSTKKFGAELVDTSKVISETEIKLIDQYCEQMDVDYAEMDCIRNRDDGKLYIIDVNITAYGPANGLRYKEKMEGLRLYQQAMIKYLK
ncbi:MAG: hypothetical protein ACJAZM_001952 [Cyclobacteriaceae bacterium]|jgi:hypothetical protein